MTWIPVVTPVSVSAGPVAIKAYENIPSSVIRIVVVYSERAAPVVVYPEAILWMNDAVQQSVVTISVHMRVPVSVAIIMVTILVPQSMTSDILVNYNSIVSCA